MGAEGEGGRSEGNFYVNAPRDLYTFIINDSFKLKECLS